MMDTIPRRNENVISRRQDDNTGVLYNPHNSSIHCLKVLGWYVWNAVDGKRSVQEIVEQMKEDYTFKVKQNRLEEILLDFLTKLEQRDLIVMANRSC